MIKNTIITEKKSWKFTKRFLFRTNISSARAPDTSNLCFNFRCLCQQNREYFSLKDYFNNWVIIWLEISAQENQKNEKWQNCQNNNFLWQVILRKLELLDVETKFQINRKLNKNILVRLFSNSVKQLYHATNKSFPLVGVLKETPVHGMINSL